MKSNNLEDRLVDFAVRIINLTTNLKNHEASLIIKRQIIRSSTSSALNYGEVQGAQSNRDFIHKLQSCLNFLRDRLLRNGSYTTTSICPFEVLP